MLTIEQVRDIEAREAVRSSYLKEHKKNWLSPAEQEALPNVTNTEREGLEIYYWHNNKPERYFLYIEEKTKEATTWTGYKLGSVTFGREYKSNMGDIRQSIHIHGTNGKHYYGTYYKSSGNYARIRAWKTKRWL